MKLRLNYKILFYSLLFTCFLGAGLFILKEQDAPYRYTDNDKYRAEVEKHLAFKGETLPIVMLGDSITYRIRWNELFDLEERRFLNRGIDGDTSAGILNRLNVLPEENLKYAFLLVGINDIRRGKMEAGEITGNIDRIVQVLQKKGLQVILQSTIYTTGSPASETNQKVKALNEKLREMGNTRSIQYIDLNTELAPEGSLLTDYAADSVHLNMKGYEIWKGVLLKECPFLKEIF